MRAIVRTFVSVGARARSEKSSHGLAAQEKHARRKWLLPEGTPLSLTLSTRSFSITGACCESCGRPNYLSPRDRLYTRFRWAGARRRDSHVAASHSFIRVRRRRPSLDQLFMISELIWRDESSRAESAIAIAARNKYGGRSLIFGWLCWFCSPSNATSWKMRRLYCTKL